MIENRNTGTAKTVRPTTSKRVAEHIVKACVATDALTSVLAVHNDIPTVQSIVSISKAAAAVITTNAPHGLQTNDHVTITGVLGTGFTAISGVYIVTRTADTTFTIAVNSSAYSGTYTADSGTCTPTFPMVSTQDFSLAQVMFGGTGAGGTVNYECILWYGAKSASGSFLVPFITATGAATFGTLAAPARFIAASGLFAHAVTETLGYSGSRPLSPANNTMAKLVIDLSNALYVQVRTDLGTASTADVLIALGESLGSFSDIEVGTLTVAGTITEASGSTIATNTGYLTGTPVAKTLTAGLKANATPGTALPLITVATGTFCRWILIQAKKTGGANTGNVFIGTTAVDATSPQQIELEPGDSIRLEAGPGCKLDVETINMDATNAADGVTFLYLPV